MEAWRRRDCEKNLFKDVGSNFILKIINNWLWTLDPRESESESEERAHRLAFIFIIINEFASNVDWNEQTSYRDYFLWVNSRFVIVVGSHFAVRSTQLFSILKHFHWLTKMIKFTVIENKLFFIKGTFFHWMYIGPDRQANSKCEIYAFQLYTSISIQNTLEFRSRSNFAWDVPSNDQISSFAVIEIRFKNWKMKRMGACLPKWTFIGCDWWSIRIGIKER